MSLTPDGKMRHPNAYAPFSGGKRVCFGKTFAEVSLKIVTTYLTQAFDVELINEEDKKSYP